MVEIMANWRIYGLAIYRFWRKARKRGRRIFDRFRGQRLSTAKQFPRELYRFPSWSRVTNASGNVTAGIIASEVDAIYLRNSTVQLRDNVALIDKRI